MHLFAVQLSIPVHLFIIGTKKKFWDRSRQKRRFSGGKGNKDAKSWFGYFARNPEKWKSAKTKSPENLGRRRAGPPDDHLFGKRD